MKELLEKIKTENKARLTGLLLGLLVLLVLLWAMVARVIIPGNRYTQAERLLEQGRTEEAIAALVEEATPPDVKRAQAEA